ncbi:MAG: hypothetical protein N3F06_03155, partial [Nitrososphaerales archaeon]|nr:hypothetical protein [Nitrososphaerales archaeon]
VEGGVVKEVIDKLAEMGIGIYQLPCPEFTYLGNPREQMTKDEYESIDHYREHVKELAKMVGMNIESLIKMGKEPKLKILGIIGITRSPSCAVKCIPVGNGYREGLGIFFEELLSEFEKRGIIVPTFEVDIKDLEKSILDLERFIRDRLDANL